MATPASPWKRWTISLDTTRLALRYGKLYLRTTYDSAAGSGQAEGSLVVTSKGTYTVSIDMPGDAFDIVIIRLIGTITQTAGTNASLIETNESVATGTGVIVETAETVCGAFLPVERSEISLLHSATSVSKKRMLFAATRETIFVNDDLASNWKVIADGLGDNCGAEDHDTSISFKMVTMGDIALFTNGFDPVIGYGFNDLPAGSKYWSADYVQDLQALRISSAFVIAKYGGFVLIGDVVADGATRSSRVYWCDYNNPLSWIPGGESAAGFHDFGRGEIVLAMEPIGGYLRVYTSKAVYDGSVTEDTRIFAFTEIYREENSAGAIRYPNTFVNTGKMHYYVGADSIYSWSFYDREPQRVEWMHVASGVMFRGILPAVVADIPEMKSYGPIDKRRCRLPVGGYDNVREAIWFSWPEATSPKNNLTMAFWPRYRKASVVNEGFTAFCNHRPDHLITLRDWIASFGICPSDSNLLPKEGAPHAIDFVPIGGSVPDPGSLVESVGPLSSTEYVNVFGKAIADGDWSEGLVANKFNTALGTLAQITLVFTGIIRTTAKIENLQVVPQTLTFGGQEVITLEDPFGNPWLTVTPIKVFTRGFDAFDGTLDYKSPPGTLSGLTTLPQTNSASVTVTITAASNPTLFAAFQQAGVGTVTLDAASTGTSIVTGSGVIIEGTDYSQDSLFGAGVNGTITYTVGPPVYSVEGKIFSDENADGIGQPSELGVADVTVELGYCADPNASDFIAFTGLDPIVTNAAGQYRFRFQPPDGFIDLYYLCVKISQPAVGTLSFGPPDIGGGTLSQIGSDFYHTWYDPSTLAHTGEDFGFSGVPVPPNDPTLDDAIQAMCGFCLTTLCDECDSDVRFLMAITGDDISIKEYDARCGIREDLSQRKAAPFPETSVGCYVNFGFTSLLQQRLNRYGTSNDKEVSMVKLNVSVPGTQETKTDISVQINATDCPDTSIWSTIETRSSCDSEVNPISESDAFWSSSSDNMTFPFVSTAQFVSTRIYASGMLNCFRISGLTMWVEKISS